MTTPVNPSIMTHHSKFRMNHRCFYRLIVAVFALLNGGHVFADAPPVDEPPLPVGFKLGDYVVKDTRPVDNQKFTLEFELYALVEPAGVESFAIAFARWEHRVRDKVLTSVRLTPVELYEEPDLDGFRRRILLRLRRAVPELAIHDVLVTDFRMLSE